MIHAFCTKDAAQYGLIEAVMLNNFRFWIAHNVANKCHAHDGRTWTYNSTKAFQELFSYLSINQIRRCLDSLIEQGVLVRGNYNASAYDKTSWFAFADEQKPHIDLANLPNGVGSSATSDTDSKPDSKHKQTISETLLDENFKPNQTTLDTANEVGVDHKAELPKFADHHTAKGSKFKDWQAAFRTWLRNAAKYTKQDEQRMPMRGSQGSSFETAYQRSMRLKYEEAIGKTSQVIDITPNFLEIA